LQLAETMLALAMKFSTNPHPPRRLPPTPHPVRQAVHRCRGQPGHPPHKEADDRAKTRQASQPSKLHSVPTTPAHQPAPGHNHPNTGAVPPDTSGTQTPHSQRSTELDGHHPTQNAPSTPPNGSLERR